MIVEQTTVPVGRLTDNAESASRGGSLNWKVIAVILLGLIVLIAAIVGASQARAHTPLITSPEGRPLQGSIASLEKVELGGVDQWLIVRGQSVDKPVLLFLSGGPGEAEEAMLESPDQLGTSSAVFKAK